MEEQEKVEIQEETEQQGNSTAKWVHGIGIAIIIGGIIGGLAFNSMTTGLHVTPAEETYYRTMALAVGISGIVSGTLFIGVGEIINLLFEINENQNAS